MSEQTVRDAMVPEPTMLGDGASAQEAGRILAENPEVRAIFVCDDGGRLVGVITRKTLVREVVATGLDPSRTRVDDIAEPPAHTLDAALPLDEAFRTLEEAWLLEDDSFRVGLGVAVVAGRRRLVLGEAALHDGARQDADEAAVLDDRNALEILLLEETESVL